MGKPVHSNLTANTSEQTATFGNPLPSGVTPRVQGLTIDNLSTTETVLFSLDGGATFKTLIPEATFNDEDVSVREVIVKTVSGTAIVEMTANLD